jgi:small subunit ribosomal protein S18
MITLFLKNESYCRCNLTSPISIDTASVIDYKNVELLRRHIGITGKILASRITTLTSKKQRFIALSIRRARRTRILPFVWLTDAQ